MAAEVGVSERLLSYLKPGAPVAAFVRSSPTGTRHGSVERISSATAGAPATVSSGAGAHAPTAMPDRFTVLAVFDNADGKLLVRAKTTWAMLDRASGRPQRITTEIVAPFLSAAT